MVIKVDRDIESYIEKIADWFDRNYGFRPARGQIVSFCLRTVDRLDDYSHDMTFRRLPRPVDQLYIKIDNKFREKIYGIVKASRYSFPNIANVVYAAVVYRSFSLPELKYKKKIPFKRTTTFTDKDRYRIKMDGIRALIGEEVTGALAPAES